MTFRPYEELPSGNDRFRTTRIIAVDVNERHPICSVYPAPLRFHVQWFQGTLPALERGQKYAKLIVPPIPSAKEYGEGKKDIQLIKGAKQCAEELLAGDDSYSLRGVFVPEGLEPTEAEIARAIAQRDEWWGKMIAKADNDYAQRKSTGDVDGNAKLAAAWLGVKREWSSVVDSRAQCPCCTEPIKVGSRKCGSCQEYITWDGGVPTWERQVAVPKVGGTRIGRPFREPTVPPAILPEP